MAPLQQHPPPPPPPPAPPRLLLLLLLASALLLSSVPVTDSRSSPIADLKSQISGVEELLEEFRKQLQHQDQEADGGGSCSGRFSAVGGQIIRTKASIEQGARFLQAPERVLSGGSCLQACCSQPHCSVAVVQEEPRNPGDSLSCYLFNCTYRGRSVCSFAPQPGFSTYTRGHNATGAPGPLHAPAGGPAGGPAGRRPGEGPAEEDEAPDVDEPPRSDAGQDVVIQLPTDWAVLDGRDSVDDRGINHYEWTLVKGETGISMKATHPGLLKVSGLQEGVYAFQMTITDTGGQKSSDNVSVTVLAPKHQAEVCTGHCSNYQFRCDDGCCIDITYACDGKQHCPDRSDEDFCPNFDSSRKTVSHPVDLPSPRGSGARTEEAESGSRLQDGTRDHVETIVSPEDRTKTAPPQSPGQQRTSVSQDPCAAAPVVGPCKGTFPRWFYDQNAGECKHFLYGGCQGNHNNFLQESDCISECIQKSPVFKPATVAPPITKQTEIAAPKVSQSQAESDAPISKPFPAMGGHPVPESGAILPLALGLLITALLLLMIGCRLKLVRHKLKKTRPLTTEESDYLINGMYL
ncbi:low-density lipoprotein receptor-related protein 11 [Limanda limanda]|uniref:low-density lipoprotein receptor-related protein 11 n=1 Tax=Limanda limanda TaxID=27771 RepID=UPI0029C7C5AD|nr:low-density lipoprotein receptor-related protein 11 [Limanda limanda]